MIDTSSVTFLKMFGQNWNKTAKIINTLGEVTNINMTNVAWRDVACTDVVWIDIAWTNGTGPLIISQGWIHKGPVSCFVGHIHYPSLESRINRNH